MNEQLLQRVKQCPTLPSLPAIAVQVLELAQKPEADIVEIARVISKDPALSGKLLRTVNSSFYGRSQHVSTISHALVILGLQSVKTLVLGFSLVSNLAKNKAKGFKHLVYWKRSIFAATAAKTLAAKLNLVQQEEAFLAALLMDIGMLVLDQVLGGEYGEICAKATTHNDLATAELQALQMTHAQVAGVMAESWKLPPLLCVPVAHHHDCNEVKDPPLRKLAELIYLSGRCADVFVDEEAARAIAEVRQLCQQRYNMPGVEADKLLAEISSRTKEVASLFEINIGSVTDFEAILKKANETLVEITLQSQMKASTLQQQNLVLKEKATTDALTGLSNRASFDAFLSEQLVAAVSCGKPLALLMLDLDKFKSVNDKYGHQAGDQVIRVIGRILKTAARAQDMAARYGGEEMSLILPNTTRATAATVAETLRRAIGARPVKHERAQIPVTASIGVSCYEPGSPLTVPAQLIKAADLALYNAKNTGRNRVRVFALKPATAPATAQAAKPAAA